MFVDAHDREGSFLGEYLIEDAFSNPRTAYVNCINRSTIYRKDYDALVTHFNLCK